MLRPFVNGLAVAVFTTASVAALLLVSAFESRSASAKERTQMLEWYQEQVSKASDKKTTRKVTAPKRKVTAPSSGIAIPIVVPIFP